MILLQVHNLIACGLEQDCCAEANIIIITIEKRLMWLCLNKITARCYRQASEEYVLAFQLRLVIA